QEVLVLFPQVVCAQPEDRPGIIAGLEPGAEPLMLLAGQSQGRRYAPPAVATAAPSRPDGNAAVTAQLACQRGARGRVVARADRADQRAIGRGPGRVACIG